MNFREIEKELSALDPLIKDLKFSQDKKYWHFTFWTDKEYHGTRLGKTGVDFPVEKVKAVITHIVTNYKDRNK